MICGLGPLLGLLLFPHPCSGTSPSSKSVGPPQEGCRPASKGWAWQFPGKWGSWSRGSASTEGGWVFASVGAPPFMAHRLGGDQLPLTPPPPMQDIPSPHPCGMPPRGKSQQCPSSAWPLCGTPVPTPALLPGLLCPSGR